MSWRCWLLVLAVLCYPALIDCEDNEVVAVPSRLYRFGVQAYLENRWADCVDRLEEALSLSKREKSAITHCRMLCSREKFTPMSPKSIEDLHFYEKIIKRTLCFLKCKRINYPDVTFDMTSDTLALKDIEKLEPYNYLQLCYLRMSEYQKAASACFTYLVRHPEHPIIQSNMKNYLQMPEVNKDDIINHEAEEYIMYYVNGMNAYDDKDWQATVSYMEEALQGYIATEDRCRALCEGPFDHGWLPDFTASIANHFTYTLRCKQECGPKLTYLNGLYGEKLLADMYNYLQYSYYQMKKIQEACQVVASYLLIEPSDDDMLHNRILYQCDDNVLLYLPRTEATFYTSRNRYEVNLLKYINEEFTGEMEHEKFSKNPSKSEEDNSL